jgi:hypothetical protein
MDYRVVHLRIHSEASRNLFVGGMLEHLFATAQHHWNVRHADVETIEQGLHRGIAVQVDGEVGKVVSRQELLHAQGTRAMP